MPSRPVLLLDIMGTLVSEPFLEDVPAFFGMSLDALYRLKDQQAWIDFEHGKITEEEYGARFFLDRRPLDLLALKQRLQASYAWMAGAEALLEELQALGYEMHALSNYSTWYRMIEDKLKLSRFLSWSFVSCETGVRKPAPEAYLGAAATLGRRPDECLFVDDRKKNVEAARAVGMPALLREADPDRFRAALMAALS